jgi:hypothetical protein
VLKGLGLPAEGIGEIGAARTRLIGELARSLGIEVITAPSDTGHGSIVAIFTDLIAVSSLDICHKELWVSKNEIPRANDEPDLALVRATERLSLLSEHEAI